MEANFFRALFQELSPLLIGKRFEKIYEPHPGILNLKFGSSAHLLVLPSPKRGAVYFSRSKPENPPTPSNRVKWLRKRLVNRKVAGIETCWPNRQAAFQLNPGPGNFLLLDLRQGLSLVDELDEAFAAEPDWPAWEEILTRERIYLHYPQLTPPLRATLQVLPRAEGRALVSDLEQGRTAGFSVGWKGGRVWTAVPWVLPRTLPKLEQVERFSRASEAAAHFGRQLVLERTGAETGRERQYRRSLQRVEKNLERLRRDRERLQGFCAEKEVAEGLRAVLYTQDVHAKKEEVAIPTPDGGEWRIALDPSSSLLENMEGMFRRARKGQRGLEQVQKREEALERTLAALKNREIDPAEWTERTPRQEGGTVKKRPRNTRDVPLHRYLTSDGFRVLQGKNQKANHALLTRVAGPNDYWFHAQDGPGAHVVLQRDTREQQVSRQSLYEVAALAGSAGYQSGSAKATVMCALVKHVHTIKGAPPGQVRVERIEESFVVSLDSEITGRLKKLST